MMSKDSILDYIKNKKSNSNGAASILLYNRMEYVLKDYGVVYFKFLIAKALKKGISNPILFNIYKDMIEFIGD